MSINLLYKNQAEMVIDIYKFNEVNAFLTGSFFLDLMVCPDLDLYIEKNNNNLLFELATKYYGIDQTDEIYLMKGRKAKFDSSINHGDHIQIKTNIETNNIKWKIDIWFLNSEIIKNKMEVMNNLKNKIDENSRNEILKIKKKLIKENGFTPNYSGFYIYDCYLNHGIKDFNKIKEILTEKGIDL